MLKEQFGLLLLMQKKLWNETFHNWGVELFVKMQKHMKSFMIFESYACVFFFLQSVIKK